MKKSYKKPIAKTIELEGESIICSSPEFNAPNDERPIGDDESNNLVGGYRLKLWED